MQKGFLKTVFLTSKKYYSVGNLSDRNNLDAAGSISRSFNAVADEGWWSLLSIVWLVRVNLRLAE